jgi:hypothetical protein
MLGRDMRVREAVIRVFCGEDIDLFPDSLEL